MKKHLALKGEPKVRGYGFKVVGKEMGEHQQQLSLVGRRVGQQEVITSGRFAEQRPAGTLMNTHLSFYC